MAKILGFVEKANARKTIEVIKIINGEPTVFYDIESALSGTCAAMLTPSPKTAAETDQASAAEIILFRLP